MASWTVPGYAEVRELGAGATGRVVLARHLASGGMVAIKYLAPRLLGDVEFVGRFRQEAEVLAGIDDPNVVRIHDYVENPNGAAIVMEVVEGPSLRRILGPGQVFSPEAALALLHGSLLGLAAAHERGVVHRDYKPENVLVDGDGTSKLADFGVAVPAGGIAPGLGTPAYMAPEQWRGQRATPATDMYAATVVFFECLAGHRPFTAGSVPELRRLHEGAPVPVDEVPDAVRSLVAAGMSKSPDDRYQDVSSFVAQLEQVAVAGYGPRWKERGTRDLAAAAAVLIAVFPLLAAGSGFFGGSATASATGFGEGEGAEGSAGGSGNGGGGAHAAAKSGRLVRRVNVAMRRVGSFTARAKLLVLGAACAAAVATTSVVIIANNGSATTPPSGAAGQYPGLPSTSVSGSANPIVASAAATPAAASYSCGTARPQVTATGTLTVDTPKTVTYQWERDDNSVAGPFTVDVLTSGTPVTADTFTPGVDSGTDTLQILSPSTTSAAATYSLTCATQGSAATVSAKAVPAAARYVCGTSRPKVTANGSISVVTPGSVTYQWLRNDGSVAGPFTLDAATSPKAAVPDTFTPVADIGSDALQILTPTTASARATFQIACDPPPGSVTVTPAAHAVPAAAAYTCGAARPQVTATGSVTASVPGKLTYQWRRDDGSVAGPFTLTASGTATQVTADTFTPTADSGADTLQVLTPAAASAKASFTVTCTQPSPTQQLTLKAAATPAAPNYTCGTQRPHVTASGTIAAATPATVTYQWSRDDGSIAGPYTLAAGPTPTAVTADTWNPPADTGSDTLQVLAPTAAATKAAFTLTCTPPVVVTPALTIQNGAGHTVTADASSSKVSTGTIADYTFDFGDGTTVGPQSSPATATHTYTKPGTFTVTVTVRATSGEKATATATATVPATVPPTAALTLTKQATASGALAILCDASASTAGDSPIASYTFTFSDQSDPVTQPGSTLVHNLGRTSSVTVTVTVKDQAGNVSAPVSKSIAF